MKQETKDERARVERERRQLAALREIQLLAGDQLGQLTSNHPWYQVFEKMHRLAASAQLASTEVENFATYPTLVPVRTIQEQ